MDVSRGIGQEIWSKNSNLLNSCLFYSTTYYDGTNPPDSYPMSASWYVYMAQNLSATSGDSFIQMAASPIVHYGGVCEGGISCTGNRDLYDDFGVAVNLQSGLSYSGYASIIYSDDQYTNNANNPPQPGCAAKQNNSISCDHTSVATQTSGTGI